MHKRHIWEHIYTCKHIYTCTSHVYTWKTKEKLFLYWTYTDISYLGFLLLWRDTISMAVLNRETGSGLQVQGVSPFSSWQEARQCAGRMVLKKELRVLYLDHQVAGRESHWAWIEHLYIKPTPSDKATPPSRYRSLWGYGDHFHSNHHMAFFLVYCSENSVYQIFT